MSIFSYTKKKTSLGTTNFRSREEAFSAMLAYLIEEKGLEPMDAARQANEFAEIFATNMGIPTKIEPQKEGVEKYLDMADKISIYIDKHPKLVDVAVPAFTFLVGLITGNKTEQCSQQEQEVQPEQPHEPIDFDKIPE